MEQNFSLSPDTEVILLLCGALGRQNAAVAPLTPGQYNVFARALESLGKRPADLVGTDGINEALVREVCAVPNTNPRITPAEEVRVIALLRRGLSLSTALDKWASYGVRVISRADEIYPKGLKAHLGAQSPALLYCAGDVGLFAGGGVAFVGSRDIGNEAVEAIRAVVRGCVALGKPVVSGGARGADQAAMQEALACGGQVVGALPCDLLKACLDPANREALAKGQALLFTAFDPELKPVRYGQVAMERNKYIYGMAACTFVAQSDVGPHSGTWSGATEELRRENRNPVYVFIGNPPSRGCTDLLGKGAKAWDMAKSVAENLAEDKPAEAKVPTYAEGDLFASFSVAETGEVAPETRKPASESVAEEQSMPSAAEPYGLFVVALSEMLWKRQKESDVKKRLAKNLDLVPAQVKHWLERAVKEGVCITREVSVGKRGKTSVVLEAVAMAEVKP